MNAEPFAHVHFFGGGGGLAHHRGGHLGEHLVDLAAVQRPHGDGGGAGHPGVVLGGGGEHRLAGVGLDFKSGGDIAVGVHGHVRVAGAPQHAGIGGVLRRHRGGDRGGPVGRQRGVGGGHGDALHRRGSALAHVIEVGVEAALRVGGHHPEVPVFRRFIDAVIERPTHSIDRLLFSGRQQGAAQAVAPPGGHIHADGGAVADGNAANRGDAGPVVAGGACAGIGQAEGGLAVQGHVALGPDALGEAAGLSGGHRRVDCRVRPHGDLAALVAGFAGVDAHRVGGGRRAGVLDVQVHRAALDGQVAQGVAGGGQIDAVS